MHSATERRRAPIAAAVNAMEAVAPIVVALMLLIPDIAAAQQKPSPGAAGLQQLGETLHAASSAGDSKTVAAITRSLLCNRADFAKAVGDDVSPEFLAKAARMHESFARTEEQLTNVLRMKAEQSSVVIHSAETEEIALASAGSARMEFPGGARRLAAKRMLRPGMTFYQMSFIEPGKYAGTTFHLFFWDGADWKMLGPIWRLVPK